MILLSLYCDRIPKAFPHVERFKIEKKVKLVVLLTFLDLMIGNNIPLDWWLRTASHEMRINVQVIS